MRTKKELEREFATYQILASLTHTYEDIALSRMQEIRKSVLVTREFLTGVEKVYLLAKASFFYEISHVAGKRKREKELEFVRRNRKTVVVLVSGNQSLLGNIVLDAYRVFFDLIHKITCDKVILGTIGRYLAKSARPNFEFTYFDFDDWNTNDVIIKPVCDFISKYEKILVVYPRFDSVLRQLPQIDDISGGVRLETAKPSKKYFFEPSAREVMSYFEGQIISTLFKQKMLESMLARYAARLTVMDHGSEAIEKLINKNRHDYLVASRRLENRKLQDMFAGLSLWEEGF